MFIRSLKVNSPLTLKSHAVFDEAMLTQIVLTSQDLEHPLAFTAIYLFGLFISRLSKMVPHSTSIFDISRHLARGDVIFSHDMAII